MLHFVSCAIFILMNAVDNSGEASAAVLEGHYWRDYRGLIPDDAIPGGMDMLGNTTYIGQVLHDDLLIPGEIRPNENKIFYELYQMEFTATQCIKILCTPFKNDYQWIKISNNKSKDFSGDHLVAGGYENGQPLYIGKTCVGKEVIVGKVSICEMFVELRIPPYKKREFCYKTFDILSYSPSASQTVQKSLASVTAETESCDKELNLDSVETSGKFLNVDITISANKLLLGAIAVCVMQYLVIVILCAITYIFVCLLIRVRQ